MSYSESFVEFYSRHHVRDDKTPFVLYKPKTKEAKTKELLTARYESRKNVCGTCFTTKASINGACLCSD